MKKEITKNIEKAYIAVSHADTLNESWLNTDPVIRNHLITIKELLKECMEVLNETTN